MTAPDAKPKHNISVRVFQPPSVHARGGLKILLLKLDHIGDFVTAIEAFRTIRHAFPGAEITLICRPAVAPLAASTGLFTYVKAFAAAPLVAPAGNVPPTPGAAEIAQFQALLDGRYFLAADFRHDGDTRHWLDRVDAECRAGFAIATQKGLDILLPTLDWDVPPAALGGKNLPMQAELRLTMLAHAIAETLLEKPLDADLFHVAEDLSEVPAWCDLSRQPRLKIGVSLGAGSPLRQWSADYWLKLLERLMRLRDAHIVFFGGPDDRPETRSLVARLASTSYIDLTGDLPLTHLAAYMNLLDCYIGCDTGLTHLAAGLGIPTVNIFAGVSSVPVWRARGPRVKTVYAEALCAPCHLRLKEDCLNGHICMSAIIPDIVYACFEQVIAGRKAHESAS